MKFCARNTDSGLFLHPWNLGKKSSAVCYVLLCIKVSTEKRDDGSRVCPVELEASNLMRKSIWKAVKLDRCGPGLLLCTTLDLHGGVELSKVNLVYHVFRS